MFDAVARIIFFVYDGFGMKTFRFVALSNFHLTPFKVRNYFDFWLR